MDLASSRGRGKPIIPNYKPTERVPPVPCSSPTGTKAEPKKVVTPQRSPYAFLRRPVTNSDSDDKVKVSSVADGLKLFCVSRDSLNGLIDFIYNFAVESEDNSRFGAMLCHQLKDVSVGGAKFESSLFQKLQEDFKNWKFEYIQLDRFLRKVNFLCDVFKCMRKDDCSAYDCLIPAIIDYFLILLHGGSEKEIELFVKHISEISNDMKSYNTHVHTRLATAIREKIISETSTAESRVILLAALEKVNAECSPQVKQKNGTDLPSKSLKKLI